MLMKDSHMRKTKPCRNNPGTYFFAQRQIEMHTIHLYQDRCTRTCVSSWTGYNLTCLRFINEERNWIEAEDGTEFWTDGSRWDYHYWPTGRPVAGLLCNTMILTQNAGFWSDEECTISRFPFVCISHMDLN
ncbi:proteoglycan 3-like isoform X3 [Mobula birostris]|uniref:proteoglycan 3-like isoform X3 n=1 Tax=Mobula birostris TaxID=1983395 RepID=UPI003B28B487